MTFNRNIITSADITNYVDPSRRVPGLEANPPAGLHPAIAEAAGGADAVKTIAANANAIGGVKAPTQDDYLTKLLKYVPAEVLGTYIFIGAVLDANVINQSDHARLLLLLLVLTLAIGVLYNRLVLKVVRFTQMIMSAFGLAIYIFTVGGWFATTTWYHPWFASIALPLYSLAVGMINLPALPTKPSVTQDGAPTEPVNGSDSGAGVSRAGPILTARR